MGVRHFIIKLLKWGEKILKEEEMKFLSFKFTIRFCVNKKFQAKYPLL